MINESTSSHKPIFANIPIKVDDIGNQDGISSTFLTQNISAKNIEKFDSKIKELTDGYSNLQANPNITDNEAKSQFTQFYTRLKEIYDECFVEKVDSNTTRNFIDKPWMTLAIAKSCQVKNDLHNKWIDARSRPNEAQAEHDFKVYRSKLRDIIRFQKSSYFNKRFNNCNGDIKKCWKVLNEMRNKRKKLTIPKFINYNGNLITQRRITIEKFNSYFVNIANNHLKLLI